MTIVDVPSSAFDLNVSEFCRTFGPRGMSVEDAHEKLECLVFRAGEYGFSLKTDPEFVEISDDDDTLPLVRGIRFLKFGPEGSTSAGEEEDMSLAIDDPIREMTTIRVLLKEWEILLSEREKQGKEKDPFEEFWGRKRYEGEPPRGYRVPVFAPTDKDDGTVVINGRIFPGPDRKFGELIFNDAFIYENERDLKYIRSLTREEFKERYQYPLETRRNVTEIEKYFEKKLEPKVIEKIYESLGTHHRILNDLHPKTGEQSLLIVAERGFWQTFPGEYEENCFVVGATSKKEYASFVGKALLGGLLTQGIRENKNDRER